MHQAKVGYIILTNIKCTPITGYFESSPVSKTESYKQYAEMATVKTQWQKLITVPKAMFLKTSEN